MKTFLTFTVWLYCNLAFSQSVTAINATNAAQYLVGNGVTISNAQFTGHPDQLTRFNNLPNSLGISNGIAITTNKRVYLNRYIDNGNPAENAVWDHIIGESAVDADLATLSSGIMGSRAYLEFDFTTTGSKIALDFVFASNEYYGYNCCNYNDVFGAFLSGPQINGNENIALIPNTTTPIGVNSINNGIPGTNCNGTPVCTNVYTNLYNASTWLYAGSTKVIHIEKDVLCQQTYHLKLAICNIRDLYYNSGIFIKMGSISSNFNLGAVTANIQPICEGQNLILTTTGSDGYTYNWYSQNGNLVQSGLNLKQITLQSNTNTTGYYVTITSPEGCVLTQSINVVVHSSANNAPYLNGINNTGEYIAYAHAGEQVCFDIPSFDNANEVVTMIGSSGIPNSTFQSNGVPFNTGHFCWTPQNNTQGSFYFDVTVTDNNACGSLSSVYTFQVNVVCENCHICVSFDGDTPNNSQLPSTVNAANCLLAGLNNPVFVGVNNSVYFQAGNYIELGPAFDTQDGLFEAVIDPVTCLEGCNDCCDNFSGFTIDGPFPSIFTPNGDGANDVFFFRDDDHPTCAFNATYFDLTIINRNSNPVYYLEGNNYTPETCCPFIAPTDGTPSSIYWDGRINVAPGIGTMVGNDTYFWLLRLKNCDITQEYHGFMLVLEPSGINQNNECEAELEKENLLVSEDNIVTSENLSPFDLVVFPNPASEKIQIVSKRNIESVELYSELGKMIFIKKNFLSQPVNVSNLANGKYLIKVRFKDGTYEQQSFVKQ
ncbi:MAG: hypothetical protein RL264_765 [Bacteroidota bacterium]|jgi:hypothetical protein